MRSRARALPMCSSAHSVSPAACANPVCRGTRRSVPPAAAPWSVAARGCGNSTALLRPGAPGPCPAYARAPRNG
jgi:hypothetical protein